MKADADSFVNVNNLDMIAEMYVGQEAMKSQINLYIEAFI